MLMTSSTATRGNGGTRGEEGVKRGRGATGWDGGKEDEKRIHKVQLIATDHSRRGAPSSRSPRLTVMGDLRTEGTNIC